MAGSPPVAHFVSLADTLSRAVPTLRVPLDFSHDVRWSLSWCREHRGATWSESALAIGELIGPPSDAFQDVVGAFRRHWTLVDGHCPDPESEAPMLMGELPHLFFESTDDLERR